MHVQARHLRFTALGTAPVTLLSPYLAASLEESSSDRRRLRMMMMIHASVQSTCSLPRLLWPTRARGNSSDQLMLRKARVQLPSFNGTPVQFTAV